MLADQLDYVIGVDPHRDTHALAIVDVRTGTIVVEASVAASSNGYVRALELAELYAPARRAFAIEGTGSFGAGLSRFLAGHDERVLEVGRVRRERRSGGKTDALDAVRAARSVLAQTRPAEPRAGGEREALRALMAAREGAVNAKRAGLCRLRDLLVTTPEPLRSELRPLTRAQLLRRLVAVRPARHREVELRGAPQALRTVARRVHHLTAEERELAREIEKLTRTLAPQLLEQPGVGPLAAAQVVLSWSHRGRIRSEAAFARLAGCAPIPASSGQTIRYRLDRSGDRQLNRALHMILVTRRRTHAPTIAYINRRIQDGKSRREANRCLKRFLVAGAHPCDARMGGQQLAAGDDAGGEPRRPAAPCRRLPQPDGVHVHGARTGEPRRDRVRLHLPAARQRLRRPCALLGTGEPRAARHAALACREWVARVRLAVRQRRVRAAHLGAPKQPCSSIRVGGHS
jgi:transposase